MQQDHILKMTLDMDNSLPLPIKSSRWGDWVIWGGGRRGGGGNRRGDGRDSGGGGGVKVRRNGP